MDLNTSGFILVRSSMGSMLNRVVMFVLALLGLFKILKLVWFGIQLCKIEKEKKNLIILSKILNFRIKRR